jgi:hypothetical protein
MNYNYFDTVVTSKKIDDDLVTTKIGIVFTKYMIHCIYKIVLITDIKSKSTIVHHIDRIYASDKIIDIGKKRLIHLLGYDNDIRYFDWSSSETIEL